MLRRASLDGLALIHRCFLSKAGRQRFEYRDSRFATASLTLALPLLFKFFKVRAIPHSHLPSLSCCGPYLSCRLQAIGWLRPKIGNHVSVHQTIELATSVAILKMVSHPFN